jgi:hypothetical protein
MSKLMLVMVTTMFISCVSNKATYDELVECRMACNYQLKAACSTMFWTICDCYDGKRIRISTWE